MSQPKQFHQQSWNRRFQKLGDEAESVFEAHYNQANVPFVRTGLNRPPLDMRELPLMVRYTPDYLTNTAYVEVQGFGKDRIFKVKDEKFEALHMWNQCVFPVDLFIWDNVTRQVAQVPLHQMWHPTGMVNYPPNVTGEYHEGKTWQGWTVEYLPPMWMKYDAN